MEGFNMLWALLSAGLIVPLVQWIKKRIPKDIPISTHLISAGLSFGVVYGLARLFVPEMTTNEMLVYAMGIQITSQTVHAAAKTKKKNS